MSRLPVLSGGDVVRAFERAGLRCTRCSCGHLPVLYTRPMPYDRIKRVRLCRNCGRRVVTYESPSMN